MTKTLKILAVLLSGALFLLSEIASAAISIEASATTSKTASGTTHEANYPAGITSGDLLAYFYIGTENSKTLSLSGWTDLSDSSTEARTGVIWKIADGSETGTVTFDYSSGSGQAGGVMIRVTGHDASTPFNSNNVHNEMGSSVNPFAVSAGTISSVATDSYIFTLWGVENAVRTISVLDSDQTLVASEASGGFTAHLAYETGVASNSAYSTTMNDSRDYQYGLFEMQAADGGGGGSSAAVLRRKRTQ